MLLFGVNFEGTIRDYNIYVVSKYVSYVYTTRMTGVGGRPEIVIEGSDSVDGPWKVRNMYIQRK